MTSALPAADGDRSVDVIVVGAGPGGAATAAWLAKAGKDVVLLEKRLADAAPADRALLQHELHQLTARLTTEVQAAVAREFDDIHTVERALRVGSIDHIVTPSDLRPYLIGAVARGLRKTSSHTPEGTHHA